MMNVRAAATLLGFTATVLWQSNASAQLFIDHLNKSRGIQPAPAAAEVEPSAGSPYAPATSPRPVARPATGSATTSPSDSVVRPVSTTPSTRPTISVQTSPTPLTASTPASVGEGWLGQEVLDTQKYIDVRDLKAYSKVLPSTSELLMAQLRENPEQFFSQFQQASSDSLGNRATKVKFWDVGARGPRGKVVEKTYTNEDTGATRVKEIFEITEDQVQTRQNSILGVEIEDIAELKPDSAFEMALILFVHDESTGHFFRRISVRIDHTTTLNSNGQKLEILNWGGDIALADTNFKVFGDLIDRKVILHDAGNQITKVMPVGVGAADIKNEAMSNLDDVSAVSLMTEEFPNATLEKTSSLGSHSHNARSRVYPSYYSGRPFISLIDEKGNYRQIGMHYKITNELYRGFVSHGCIRVRDQDLYQLDAIVNDGPHQSTPAQFLLHIPEFAGVDHIYPRIDDWYNAVVYKNGNPGSEKIQCANDTYTVRQYHYYHTLADSDCLTMVRIQNRSTAEFVNFIKGISYYPPFHLMDLASPELTHAPLQAEVDASIWNESRQYESANLYREQLAREYYNMIKLRDRATQTLNNLNCGNLFGLLGPNCNRARQDRDFYHREANRIARLYHSTN